jgi:hypothetical protein
MKFNIKQIRNGIESAYGYENLSIEDAIYELRKNEIVSDIYTKEEIISLVNNMKPKQIKYFGTQWIEIKLQCI